MTLEEKVDALMNSVTENRLQINRLVADAESEKGTRSRINDHILKLMQDNHDSVMDVLYGKDRISGLVVELDRQRTESIRTQTMWNWIRALALAVTVGIVNEIVKIFRTGGN